MRAERDAVQRGDASREVVRAERDAEQRGMPCVTHAAAAAPVSLSPVASLSGQSKKPAAITALQASTADYQEDSYTSN